MEYPGQGLTLGQPEVLKMQAKLFQKIFNVTSKLENIKKSGYNSHQKYHYATEQDLVESVRQLLIDNKLVILTDSEVKKVIKLSKLDGKGNNKESLVTVVNTRHTFCDIETGYTYNIQSTGTGWDDTDKGSFKAITGAMKYFISKNFLVPGEDDAENDGVTERPAPQVAAPTRFNRPAAQTTPVVNEAVVTKVEEKVSTPVLTVEKQDAPPVARPSFGRKVPVKNEPNFP